MNIFNRNNLNIKPLSARQSKSDLSIMIQPESKPEKITKEELAKIKEIAESIKESRKNNAPVIFAFGAHFIKNGLALILIELMKQGYVQHILGNGAVSIHDWELAFQGKTEEDVKKYIAEGQFGIWQETGFYMNKAINLHPELGYGQALGKFMSESKINHPYKQNSILAQAYQLKIPLSICTSIGHDIIYTHPECKGESIGKASYVDFLKFVTTLENFEHGTYISIGSAITSPMVFEKALSMVKNIAIQKNKKLENYNIFVVDIQPGTWDWSKGEPGKDHPAYYLRFCKTFSRMQGEFQYIKMDNKYFLHNLYHQLR
ncbi:MAG TPA: hypothetical protein VJJ21_02615 [Candidatus Nanoarchaeia archaeon]|nr:hypothetical protein [Candidatus Nanoarchaeia archaeon]